MNRFTFPTTFLFSCLFSFSVFSQETDFDAVIDEQANPWTHLNFQNDPEIFQFAIVSDRTGGHRKGVFGKAVEKLNLLMPEFVMSVGDFIEGYSNDSALITTQWAEFDSLLAPLEMPFFFVPGNHDISSKEDLTHAQMYRQWMNRYGRTFYHFVYKEVLFIAMNTNDGDEVMLSEEQLTYVKNVLAENEEVRWTFFFMHHPIWRYGEINGFAEVEAALGDRPYTVLAGHTHHYLYEERNNQRYIVLGTTGGGSQLRGPKFGEYDHVTWVTMTDQGPKMLNVALDGMLDINVSDKATLEMARALLDGVSFDYQILSIPDPTFRSVESSPVKVNKPFLGGAALLSVENSADVPMFFRGRFFHHHEINPTTSKFKEMIPAHSAKEFNITLQPIESILNGEIAPLELDWEMGFPTDKLEPSFQLSGTFPMELRADPKGISSTAIPIFLNEHRIELKSPFENATIRYTLDGSEPNIQSPEYKDPIQLSQTTEIKAKLFGADEVESNTYSYTYKKVIPKSAEKVKRAEPGLSYHYFEGNFLVVPDFDTLKAIKSGIVSEFNPEMLSERKDHFALLFEGYVEVPASGVYTFYTYSDDGSNLYIGDELVVDNDGSHSARMRTGMIALEAGKHRLRLEYFEDFMGESLRVGYEAPGEKMMEIPFEQFSH